jgi:protein-tyrosine phosphatase
MYYGPRFHHLEIMDLEPPPREDAFDQTVLTFAQALQNEEKVLAHCAAGCGRTGVVVACILVHLGMAPGEAIRTYRRARGCGPETSDQTAYIFRYALRRF